MRKEMKLLIKLFYQVKGYELASGRSVINETTYFEVQKVVENAISGNNISRSTG